jgi:hypothetical protein
VNRENIQKVRDHIAGLNPEQFDMTHWCGTACCIAGWTAKLFDVDPGMNQAGAVLGLGGVPASDLFLGFGSPTPLTSLQQSDAVAVLDHLLQTGEVDWAAALAGSAAGEVSTGNARDGSSQQNNALSTGTPPDPSSLPQPKETERG